ncbi:peptide/nickel transport system permease protein [Labrenzia sp. EL_208]|uniref:Glutathione transport system permease protein GsiC n=1 Tax=Roseibium album TaxID=311410 RepID=A0A0M7AWL9_9HYPH|nr:ABC transporter permease [Roseibium album]MBG6146771.1 peptide/nickel transport system permease protein [Labrenzia sp. EL_142]MBG6155837.1 peptide/nickel transport system permease protein [Labrenzia sp. EL_162]MBG6161292.1 peptide/nickel transport system permease protein [Labrenzia sp. EL_195]MBG6177181.1 peptide/nickel transport system permease protein [Labrenzia sp. EL_132]MBG6194371.1 peptide/nickel transport system permease protein [Labrenzia sp. EL_159]MBG6200696.1 peptide/nickel tran
MSYPIKRLLVFPLVMLGVSVFVFISIRLVPGDAITAMLGTESGLLTPTQRDALRAYFGLDQNWFIQFWRWFAGVLQGDFGISTTYGKPVMTIIWQHFPLTLELAILSMLIALSIGIPAGIYAATHKDRPSDLIVRIVAMFGQSTPSFVVGLLLIYLLSVGFGVLPEMGTFVPITEDPLANLAQMILPAITLGTAFAAAVIRMSRSTMLDILQEDYVRTARSKGMSRRRVIWRHALPNALIPVITLSGVEFGYLLGGAVLVEQIFALPGLGRTVLDAILQRDYALVQGSVLFIAFNFMVVNLLVDLAYAALDPRIRFETK